MLNDVAGGSSIEQLRFGLSFGLAPSELARRFDIVALDLRGTGHSDPFTCSKPNADSPAAPLFPTDQTEFDAVVAANRSLASRCAAENSALLSNLDTTSVVRDVEAVRRGLGQAQISWYGIGYSARLGTAYARLFPGQLRAMVNDSATDTTTAPVERLAAEMTTAEESFNRFTRWCGSQPSVAACPLAGRDVAADFDRLTAAADKAPIPAHTQRALTGDDIRAAAQDYLNIQQPQWPAFAAAIRSALGGDATAFTITQDKTLNLVEARVQACADNPAVVDDLAGVRELSTMAHRLSPHLGGAVAGWRHLIGCIGWPVASKSMEQTPVPSAPPALFLASVHQSSTPYSWSFGAARQLPGSVILSRDADDYSMFLFSHCARTAMTEFLTDLVPPPHGQICTD
ncbi:MAG: alpha/beta fold hydrolase [Williamsia sp.]|nr:alpha/beta fold hydrolase [Williamsia sp.]MBJ7291538.1 alpha/beta fold hydrolase [Williamsia sp.]